MGAGTDGFAESLGSGTPVSRCMGNANLTTVARTMATVERALNVVAVVVGLPTPVFADYLVEDFVDLFVLMIAGHAAGCFVATKYDTSSLLLITLIFCKQIVECLYC